MRRMSSVSVSSVCCERTIFVTQHFPMLAGDCRNPARVVNSTNGLQERHGARVGATVCTRHGCVRVCAESRMVPKQQYTEQQISIKLVKSTNQPIYCGLLPHTTHSVECSDTTLFVTRAVPPGTCAHERSLHSSVFASLCHKCGGGCCAQCES